MNSNIYIIFQLVANKELNDLPELCDAEKGGA